MFLGILVLSTALQIWKRPLMKRFASRIFLYSAGLAFIYLIWIGYLQFQAFMAGPLQYTLGTPEGLKWFFGYLKLHFWNEYLLSLPIAVLFALIASWFNRKYQERFFEKEELYFIAIGILLTGYPAFIFYIPLVLIASIVASLVFVRRGERLPLYHFWIPTALVVFLAVHLWAVNQVWWGQFRF